MKDRSIVALSILSLIGGCTPPESLGPGGASATADESTSSTGVKDPDPFTTEEPTTSTSDPSDATTAGTTTAEDPSTSSTTVGLMPVCGDGVVDKGEECDLGLNNDNDGACTDSCALPKCGDGYIQRGEACDLGESNDNEGACTNVCAVAACGDGFKQSGEECDMGKDNDVNKNGGCHPETCTIVNTCGDGELQEGEECDKSAENDLAMVCTKECLIYRKVIFVSTEIYPPIFGGVSAADDLCKALAKAAVLENSESFIAWMSAPQQPAANRLSPLPYRYARTDSVVVANSPADLLDGQLIASIRKDAFGADASMSSAFVWTGTKANGLADGDPCVSWTVAKPDKFGLVGSLLNTDKGWTESMIQPCTQNAHVYCVET